MYFLVLSCGQPQYTHWLSGSKAECVGKVLWGVPTFPSKNTVFESVVLGRANTDGTMFSPTRSSRSPL